MDVFIAGRSILGMVYARNLISFYWVARFVDLRAIGGSGLFHDSGSASGSFVNTIASILSPFSYSMNEKVCSPFVRKNDLFIP